MTAGDFVGGWLRGVASGGDSLGRTVSGGLCWGSGGLWSGFGGWTAWRDFIGGVEAWGRLCRECHVTFYFMLACVI